MLPSDSNESRDSHLAPNDRLYFYKETKQRVPKDPSYNEPTYLYRETKLEMVPRTRTNDTYSSSVFDQGDYRYDVKTGEFHRTNQEPCQEKPTNFNSSYQDQFCNNRYTPKKTGY